MAWPICVAEEQAPCAACGSSHSGTEASTPNMPGGATKEEFFDALLGIAALQEKREVGEAPGLIGGGSPRSARAEGQLRRGAGTAIGAT